MVLINLGSKKANPSSTVPALIAASSARGCGHPKAGQGHLLAKSLLTRDTCHSCCCSDKPNKCINWSYCGKSKRIIAYTLELRFSKAFLHCLHSCMLSVGVKEKGNFYFPWLLGEWFRFLKSGGLGSFSLWGAKVVRRQNMESCGIFSELCKGHSDPQNAFTQQNSAAFFRMWLFIRCSKRHVNWEQRSVTES